MKQDSTSCGSTSLNTTTQLSVLRWITCAQVLHDTNDEPFSNYITESTFRQCCHHDADPCCRLPAPSFARTGSNKLPLQIFHCPLYERAWIPSFRNWNFLEHLQCKFHAPFYARPAVPAVLGNFESFWQTGEEDEQSSGPRRHTESDVFFKTCRGVPHPTSEQLLRRGRPTILRRSPHSPLSCQHLEGVR